MYSNSFFYEIVPSTVVERLELPSRTEILAPIPACFDQGSTARWLTKTLGDRRMLWQHQTRALESVAAGDNIVVSTGTASGKSLIFQIPIIKELLDGEGSALVLYPQKALGGDQLVRWQAALELAGLTSDLVGEINGDVAMSARGDVLDRARIILATPDVVHAWMMRHLAAKSIRRFLASVRYLVIDEAHVFEGAFGSNSAFLFRRFMAARSRTRSQFTSATAKLQIIAATATIADAGVHLQNLTGLSFVEVSETENGAPCHERTILHVEGQAVGETAEQALAHILCKLADKMGEDAFIAFADSRQGVERISRLVGRDDVLPYRSGYEGADRRAIEQALREGQLRGVVSTSALELGIDIPLFTIGLNLGIPLSRKALRQRIGRVGRSKAGLFALIAPSPAFAQLGVSLRAFYEGSVEPSHLYCGNEIVQFAQARCLREEIEGGSEEDRLPEGIDWPTGFDTSYAISRPGAPRSASLDQVAALGGDSPHLNYPIRNICETEFALRLARGDQAQLGKISLSKAIREAYPGAIYYHMRRAHRVVEWRSTSYDRTIRLEPIKAAETTKALLKTQVAVATGSSELIDGRLLASSKGSFAEIHMRVSESVEGYRSGAAIFLYRDLKERDPKMRRKVREIGTTGILLRIDEPWFAGTARHQVETRKAVARALLQLTAADHSIAPGEIASDYTGIALYDARGARRIDDAIVIYDNVAGGLRLSAPLFDEIGAMIDRLAKAAVAAGVDALISLSLAERLDAWHSALCTAEPVSEMAMPAEDGEYLIFAPMSEVGVRHGGTLQMRTLIEPTMVPVGETSMLMYLYESTPGARALVPHEQIEPVGDNWRRAYWNPLSSVIREFAA